MFQTLLNPFNRIAGFTALGYGCIAMFLTAVIAAPCGTNFVGSLNIHAAQPMPFSLIFFLILLGWLIAAACFCIAGMLFSMSKFRTIDVFGTFALARAPFLLAAPLGLLFGRGNIDPQALQQAQITVSTIIGGTVCLFVVIWVVILSYNAFAVSANVQHKWLFTGVFIMSEIVAMILSGLLATVLLLGVSGKAPTPEDAEHVEIARQFVERFFAGTDDDPLEQFQVIDVMKSFVTADSFKKWSNKIIETHGKPGDVAEIKVVRHSPVRRSVYLFFHCERQPIKIWITFDDNVVSGFHYGTWRW